jgi:superfamily I DNA/RNA helicase
MVQGGSRQRGIENITRLKQDAFNLARDQFAPELLLLEQNMKSQENITDAAKASMEDKRKQFEQTAMAEYGFFRTQ